MELNIGDRVFIPESTNLAWTGNGVVVKIPSVFKNEQINVYMTSGKMEGTVGGFLVKNVILTDGPLPTPEPEIKRYIMDIDVPARNQKSLPADLQLIKNMQLLAAALDKFPTGGEQAKNDLLLRLARLVLAMAAERL